MFRTSIKIIGTVLAAAIVVVPVASAGSPRTPAEGNGTHHAAVATAKVDPLAVGYLIGQGLSPSQVTSWTVGACSHQTKAPSCYAMLEPASTSSTQVTGSTGGARLQRPVLSLAPKNSRPFGPRPAGGRAGGRKPRHITAAEFGTTVTTPTP
jgi:hypothetical protein